MLRGYAWLLFAFATSPALISKEALTQTSDCSFEDEHTQFDPDHAERDAALEFERGKFFFFAVANGIGPARPGFENVPMTRCLMLDAEWKILWVGADGGACENPEFLEKKALDYAQTFNKEMLDLLKGNEAFVCAEDLASAH